MYSFGAYQPSQEGCCFLSAWGDRVASRGGAPRQGGQGAPFSPHQAHGHGGRGHARLPEARPERRRRGWRERGGRPTAQPLTLSGKSALDKDFFNCAETQMVTTMLLFCEKKK